MHIDMSALEKPVRISKNIIFSYVNQVSALITALLLVPVFTRLLGQRVYGEWLVISAVVSNLYLASSGFDQTLVNSIAEAKAADERSKIATTVSTVLFLHAALACLLIVAFALLAPELCRLFVSRDDTSAASALLALGALTALALPFRTHLMLLRGLGRVYEEQRIATWINVGRIMAIPTVLFCGLRLFGVSVVYGCTALCGGVLAYLRARSFSEEARPHLSLVSLHSFRLLLKPSLAFALLQVAGRVGFGIDTLVIGYVMGPANVTRYAVSYCMMLVGIAVYSTLTTALLPTITAMYADNDDTGVRRALSVLVRIALLYAGAASIALWIGGRCLLVWWAGAGIYPGDRTFELMIFLLVIQIVIEPPWMLLVATTQHYRTAAIHTIESVLNFALSLWWVRRWGLSGVIAGTVVARIVTTGWYVPIAAAWIMGVHFSDIRMILAAQVLVPASTGALVLLLLAIRSSLFPALPVPVTAGFATAVFAVAFTYVIFNRDERKAALDRVYVLLQRRQWNIT
jgi:O-antigen/teichoic acid export membrane protein